jgi:hypothetical protein
MLSNIKPRIRRLVPQAKLSVIEYIYAKFFSFDSKTNCFAAFNGCKTFKMDKNLVFSTFDPRLLTLDLDLDF